MPRQVARSSSPSARLTSRLKPRSENSAPGLLTVLWITSSLPRNTSTSVTARLSTLRIEIAIKCAWLLLRAVSISVSSSSRSDRDSTGAATSIRSSNANARTVSGGAVSIGARRLASSALAAVSMWSVRHWKTSSNSAICSSEKSTAPLMKRSVTRRRVSTRRATVPCASVACNSSSRLSEVEAGFELMTLSWSIRTFSDRRRLSSSPETEVVGSGAGNAVAPLCLGCVKRAVGACEKCIGGLIRFQRRDACGNRYLHAGRERAPVEVGDDRLQPVQSSHRFAIGSIGKHQQEFLATVAAKLVDVTDVREHGDGECPEHFVARGMAVGVIDALEPVEIDQRDRAGRIAASGAGNLVIQHPLDAAAVERAGELVEFGELFDSLVGLAEFDAAFVKPLAHRVAVKPDEGALSDRENEAQYRGEALGGRGHRQADGNPGQKKNRGHAENKKQHVEKSIANLGRSQQKSKLDSDVTADLKNREIMIFKTIVDVSFGQKGKDANQRNAAQEKGRGEERRNRAGMDIDQQDGGAERIACDLHRQGMPAMRQTALQHMQR